MVSRMLELIIGAFIAAAGFFGGFMVGQKVIQIQNIQSTTAVETRADTRQVSMQGQVTVIFNQDGQKTEYISINLNDITNIDIIRTTNSNSMRITNHP